MGARRAPSAAHTPPFHRRSSACHPHALPCAVACDACTSFRRRAHSHWLAPLVCYLGPCAWLGLRCMRQHRRLALRVCVAQSEAAGWGCVVPGGLHRASDLCAGSLATGRRAYACGVAAGVWPDIACFWGALLWATLLRTPRACALNSPLCHRTMLLDGVFVSVAGVLVLCARSLPFTPRDPRPPLPL